MKKLFVLLLAVIMAGCGSETVQQNREVSAADNYRTVCEYIAGYMQPAPGGRYELLRHTDGSADILYTDIATATRKPLGGDTTVEIAHEVVTGIFVRDGYLYHYSHGAPLGMKEEEDEAVLYQYDMDGKLLQACRLGRNIEPDMDSAVVSDGKWLYFTGSELMYENGKVTESTSHIYAVNQENMEIKKVYTPQQAAVDIICGYRNSLVTEVTYYKTDKDGNREFKTGIELLDMKTLERKPLFTTSNLWYSMCDGKLYNPYDTNGSIKIYDLEKQEETTVEVVKDARMLKNGYVAVNIITERYAFLSFEYYNNMPGENYVYDFETDTLSPAPDFCEIPYLYSEESGYYMVQTGYDKVPVAEDFYTVYDIRYALITPEDYHSGTENLIPVTNIIEYR